jgi:hypothetical protein
MGLGDRLAKVVDESSEGLTTTAISAADIEPAIGSSQPGFCRIAASSVDSVVSTRTVKAAEDATSRGIGSAIGAWEQCEYQDRGERVLF